MIKLAWSKGAQITLIGPLLEQSGINVDLVDLEALVDDNLTLPENIEIVSKDVGKNILSDDVDIPALDEMVREFHQKAYESGAMDKVYMENKWLDIIPVPSVVLLRGRRRWGKTALGCFLLWLFFNQKHMTPYIVNFPKNKRKLLPKWIKTINDLNKLPKGCIAMMDEVSLKWAAQKYNLSEKEIIDQLISISGQKDQIIIIISHHAAKILLSMVREVDVQLFKLPSKMHSKLERSEIRVFTKEALEAFENLHVSKEEKKAYTYVITDDIDGEMLTNPLPEFWSEELSKAWGDLKFESKIRDNLTDKELRKALRDRVRHKKVKRPRGVAIGE
ncbi:hypothetical protein LCGC14_0926610 [marine sediment metagenome]|uniref:Zona occludens toxin N-terminal domain-containing protein n=1 Tax=marine sediment metagenome TaxID=412755 RepID=A0A0F9NU04_9ZZZZ